MQGRPRTPLNILQLRGADKVNPGRYKARLNQMQPDSIGRMPQHLEAQYRPIWKEVSHALPPGTLGKTDRIALELLCKLIYAMRTDFESMSSAKLSKLETLLVRFGMTPSDRSRITQAQTPKKEHNPFDDL